MRRVEFSLATGISLSTIALVTAIPFAVSGAIEVEDEVRSVIDGGNLQIAEARAGELGRPLGSYLAQLGVLAASDAMRRGNLETAAAYANSMNGRLGGDISTS